MGQKDIVNYWELPSKISRNRHNILVTKIARHYWWKMFVGRCPCDRLVCFADAFGKTLLVVFFLLPTQQISQSLSSLTLCSCIEIVSTFNNVWIFGAADSNKSAPSHFAAGTTCLRKNGIADLPDTCASLRNPVHVVDQNFYKTFLYLSWSNHLLG